MRFVMVMRSEQYQKSIEHARIEHAHPVHMHAYPCASSHVCMVCA